MALALGRRSEIRGIPWWLIWPVGIILTIYFLSTSTPELLEFAQNTWQRVLAFWPLLIIVAALILQRAFRGKVNAATSTAIIEFLRGVP
jgi:hypothetical protein